VPLVIAPTTVKDANGHYVEGLQERNLVLYDNNVQQTLHLDYDIDPIAVVVAIQNGHTVEPMLDKLGNSGILLSQLVAGGAGETAVLSFSDEVREVQGFTTSLDAITRALKRLRSQSEGASSLDALNHALQMLDTRRPPQERRIVLLIAESRARGGQASLPEVVKEVQRQNALVYWLTFSTTFMPYTDRPKTVGQRKQKEDRGKFPSEDAKLAPANTQPMNLLAPFFALAHLAQPNLAELFSRTTGGLTGGFLIKRGLEQAIEAIGQEVHRQYIISYQPPAGEPSEFHKIRVEVRGHPEFSAKTREGYWGVQ
jgi:VWFA-related protein